MGEVDRADEDGIVTDTQGGDVIAITNRNSGPMHSWFGLSYAQYLTVPRSVIQEMPIEWQERFAACLDELDDAFDWYPKDGRYWVRLKDGGGRYARDPLMEYRRPDLEYIDSIRLTHPPLAPVATLW